MKYVDFLKNSKNCPFCVSERKVIIENENAFLTFAAAPYHPDHLLVAPKRHNEHIVDLNDDEVRDISSLQKAGLKILNKLGYINICIFVKEGDIKEKSISHTHYHLIPDIILGDSNHTGADRMMLTDVEISNLVSRINSVIE